MKYLIPSSYSDQRIDKWIKKKFPGIPQSLIEKLSRKGLIKLNGKKIITSQKIKSGDKIDLPSIKIYIKKKKKIDPSKTKELSEIILKNIIYKDNHKIILNKPGGVSVHHGSKVTVSIDDIKNYLKFNSNDTPRIVHRIDKETSGILIVARSYSSSVFLSKQFKEKNIKKFYIAITNGMPEKNKGEIYNSVINGQIKKSITKYYVIKRIKKQFSFILLQPITGKKRQLREHCYKLGCPIIGDNKYFKKSLFNNNKQKKNLLLHAYKIYIPNKNGKIENFIAPLPYYIKKFCNNYKLPCNYFFLNKFIDKIVLKDEIS